MKKYFFIVLLSFSFLENISFASTLNDNEEYICQNLKTEACIELCKLKKNGAFVEVRDVKLLMSCASDFSNYRLEQEEYKDGQ